MAEMVGSAVAEETLKQVMSGLIGNHRRREEETAGKQHMERLEMAQIKLEAALQTSRRWQIRDAALLRWRKKLKRAADECHDTLRECEQRAAAAVEDEAREQETRRGSSFPRRLAHATRSLFATLFSGGRGGHASSSAAAVRRFEWLADGAGEFLRFVELGGTPRRYAFVDPLIGHLLAGQELRYRFVRRSQYHLFCVRPINLDDRGMEAKLLFVYEDDEAPEKNLCLGSILRLSESTDLVGTIIKCLELLVTPHFKPTAESARRELVQLPTQDFSWVPYVESTHKEHWNTMHSSLTQWFRPNPLCCKKHEPKHSYSSSSSNNNSTNNISSSSSSRMKLSDVADLEPVIEVFLQRHIPLSEYSIHAGRAADDGESGCLKNLPHLKLGLLFSPHGSSEDDDMAPEVESSATQVIDGVEQSGGALTNISLEELDELMLPRAIDCLHRNREAAAYQMSWRSRHGAAFLQVEKTTGLTTKTPPGRGGGGAGSRRSAMRRRRDPKLERWIQVVIDFLNLWVAHAPRRLQGSFVEWVQKANEMQLGCQAN